MTPTKPEDALVEKVARAMCGYDLEWRDCERACLAGGKCAGKMNEHQLAEARAAIEASGITTLLERERRLAASARTLLEKLDSNSSVRWQFVNESESLRTALIGDGK